MLPFIGRATAAGTAFNVAKITAVGNVDPALDNDQVSHPLKIVAPKQVKLDVRTFDDRNGNGKQDADESSLPDAKVKVTGANDQSTEKKEGSTDANGRSEFRFEEIESPSDINVHVSITRTVAVTEPIGLNPRVEVSINKVPPTGQANIVGSTHCGMTVYDANGGATALDCANATLSWTNQLTATVATFAANALLDAPLRTTARPATRAANVGFTIKALPNQVVYLPLIREN